LGGVLSAHLLFAGSPRRWFPRSVRIRPRKMVAPTERTNRTVTDSQASDRINRNVSPTEGRASAPKLTRTRLRAE